jgi:hypothetical protein
MGGTLKIFNFQNSEYKVRQVGPKDAGNRIFSFLFSRRDKFRLTTATVRERRILFSLKSCFLGIKNPKTLKSIKKIFFLATKHILLFHISYEASKKFRLSGAVASVGRNLSRRYRSPIKS